MKKIFFFLMLLVSTIVPAQRFELLEGDLKNVRGINAYNVTFDYSQMKVHGYETEEAFLTDKMSIRKGDKAEKFKEEWFSDRENRYEPSFIAYFNKRFPNGEIKVEKNPEVKYTMNVSTIWVYPGYVVEPAKISAIITISETGNPQKILAKLQFDKSIGLEENQYNGHRGDRMAGAYEKLAKNMVIQLKRFL
ncbi:hypothetical protein FEDK69T_11600 [Flavobacterium enshiense DK69]|uniref:DUF4468 domain-containing protein n=1 Tax=Flavobacterium enshiense DK69 TaxID=1107311 RepID=V6SAR8_9FLAO|nr:hypothetical protein [Flavobacterium enshiense]ESU23753.1 hypothetical protein FEDK69T_11600 [Flavobacterium enshiense DK69]KGO96120.1 hypothetical protein Q767_07610 [Flavobacterium enshiense DK69]